MRLEVAPLPPTGSTTRRILLRGALIAITGVTLYLLAPSLVAVYASLDDVLHLRPEWLAVIVLCEALSFVCVWELLRLALETRKWFVVATSQLASNAFSLVVPGGAAAGAALQMRMLTVAGVDTTRAASSLSVVALITTASMFATPIFALPALLGTTGVARELLYAVWLGVVGAVLLGAALVIAAVYDRPVIVIGALAQRLRNRFLRNRPPLVGLPGRLLVERDLVKARFSTHKGRAIAATAGKVGFDYLALLAALAAVGADPQPTLVLLAFAASQIAKMIPITPGGLGFVEAGLTGALALAGVGAAQAIVATAAYRLVSFFLPIVAGAVAYVSFRVERGRSTRAPA